MDYDVKIMIQISLEQLRFYHFIEQGQSWKINWSCCPNCWILGYGLFI